MSATSCIRTRPDKNKSIRHLLGSGLPGIPSAPIFRRAIRSVEYNFAQRKLELQPKLPVYSLREVQRLGNPFHVLVINTLLENGYISVVDEIQLILRKEETEMLRNRDFSEQPLLTQQENFTKLAESLKLCEDLIRSHKYEQAVTLRKDLAIKMLKHIWLAKHLLQICLRLTEPIKHQKERFQAEIHCLLAFLCRQQQAQTNSENITSDALIHLEEARRLSKNEHWHFQPNVVLVNIRKSIDLHGLRTEEIFVDGNTMPLYMVASLLEHEMLLKRANQVLFSQSTPTDEDVLLAIQFAEDALRLALDVRQEDAMGVALIRFGDILRDSGAVEEAMNYYDQACLNAEMKVDKITEAIGYHGLGTCFNHKKEPLNALEMFALENEKGVGIMDVQAEAYRELGHILLTEGQVMDAKECFHASYNEFSDAQQIYNTPQHWLDDAWGLIGVGQGQGMWSRLTGLIRRNSSTALKGLVHFKNVRTPLPHVRRPNYEAKLIGNEYIPLNETGQVPPSQYLNRILGSSDSDPNTADDTSTVSMFFRKHSGHEHHHHHNYHHHHDSFHSERHRPASDHPQNAANNFSGDGGDIKKRQISFTIDDGEWVVHDSRTGMSEKSERSAKEAASTVSYQHDSKYDTNSYSGSSTLSPETIFDTDMVYESDLGRKSHSTLSDNDSTKSKHSGFGSTKSGKSKHSGYGSDRSDAAPSSGKSTQSVRSMGNRWKSAVLLDRFRLNSMSSTASKHAANRIPSNILQYNDNQFLSPNTQTNNSSTNISSYGTQST